jgi:DNA polymerase-3 subunit gamma/tau
VRPSVSSPDAGHEISAWRAILDRVRALKPALASVLEHAMPLAMSAERVMLGFDARDSFLAGQAKEPDALEILTREVRAHFGRPTEVALDLSARASPGTLTVAAIEAERRAAREEEARQAVAKHPLVREALTVFGAELREVKLPPAED